MPIAKPEYISGNRGRTEQMTCGDAMRYLANSREEKGRELSILLDSDGRELTVGQAIERMGGEDGVYHNSIWGPSPSERAFLEERFGGRAEAQRAVGLLMLERTGAKDGLFAIHDHGDDGWHVHLSRHEVPKELLYGEYGAFQRIWDREMEVLRGEANRPIVDWEAHGEFNRYRVELEKLQIEQRLLAKDRFMALRGAAEGDKAAIREDFQVREYSLIRERREVELRAAEARYRSRDMVGSSSHQIEIERIEKRAATSITRMDSRNSGQDLSIDRKRAWSDFRHQDRRYKALEKAMKLEAGQIESKHSIELETARARAEKNGTLGSEEFRNTVELIDARRDAAREDLELRSREAASAYQRSRCISFAIGPISRGFLEWRELERLSVLSKEREAMEIHHANRRHELAGTLGTQSHQRDLERAHLRQEEAQERHQRSYLVGLSGTRVTRVISSSIKASRIRGLARTREALEVQWAKEEAQTSRDRIDERHRERGTLGSLAHHAEQTAHDAALRARLDEIGLRSKERQIAARQPILRSTLARGPLSRVAVESVELRRLLVEAKSRRDRGYEAVDSKHAQAKTLGSKEHKLDRKAIQQTFSESRQKITGRGRQVAKDAAVSQGRRVATRSASALGSAAQKVVKAAQRELKGQGGEHKHERALHRAALPAKDTARAATKAVLAMGQEATIAAAKAAKEMAVHGGMAAGKLSVGLLAAIPSGGASLKIAAKEASRDLAEGAKGAGKETAVGVKNVSREGVAGVAQTSIATLRGVKGLAEELIPSEGAAAVLKAAQAGTKALAKTTVKAISLDLTGAGKEAVMGGLAVGKEAAAAIGKAAELPAVIKLPLQIAEKLPVVGQLVSLAKGVTEITATATGAAAKGMELDL